MTEHDVMQQEGASAMGLSNYLFFTTTCEEALAFYTDCGLGQVVDVLRYGVGGMTVKSETMRGKIMRAKFEGPGILFYASNPCVVPRIC